METGKLKIEYKQDNNVIQIYNSAKVCSLVINGKIADEYRGVVASRFKLKGTIEKENKAVQIVAEMGYFYMRLYYDGILVSKKFMAFG
ncbi:MAG: hypothetical protein K2N22_01075 [Clostridia bacterium]|nr:hypothetical protein [Clostridia bacterium]